MFDRNTVEQILCLHWHDWTISEFCFIDYDEDAMEYRLWQRIAKTNYCVLEGGGDKDYILGDFLQMQSYADNSDNFGEAEICSVEGKNIALSEQEQLIINLVFKSAPLMDALLDVMKG